MMRRLDPHLLPLHRVSHLHPDAFGSHIQRPPFILELVFAVLDLFFIRIRSIRTTCSHGNREITAVSQNGKWQSHNRHTRYVQLSAIDPHLVPATLSVPAHVRIDDGDWNMQSCA